MQLPIVVTNSLIHPMNSLLLFQLFLLHFKVILNLFDFGLCSTYIVLDPVNHCALLIILILPYLNLVLELTAPCLLLLNSLYNSLFFLTCLSHLIGLLLVGEQLALE